MDEKTLSVSEDIAFFEYIGLALLPSVFIHVLLSHTIFYLEIDKRLAKAAWLKDAQSRKKIVRVYWNDVDPSRRFSVDGRILTDVEQFSKESGNAKKGIIRLLGSFFGSEKIGNAYEKSHAMGLVNRYRFYLTVQDIGEKFRITGTIAAYPKDPASILIRPHNFPAGSGRNFRVSIPPAVWISAYARHTFLKVRNTGMLCALPFWLLIKIGIPSVKKTAKEEFSTALRIYTTDFAFYQKYRSIDFLLDNATISRDNAIFCLEMEISSAYRDNLAKRNYRCADMRTILRGADLSFIKNTILLRYLSLWLRSVPRVLLEPPHTILTTLEILHAALIWERFCSICSCRTYVAYNDTIPKHIVRNLILERHGTKTLYYVFSCNTPDYFTPPGKDPFLTVYYSHMNYDYVIAWNEKVKEYYTAHTNTIGKVAVTGCLWSEHVADIQRKQSDNEVFASVKKEVIRKNSMYPRNTISVFDTTFGGGAPLNVQDILVFLRDILKLIDEFADIAVIFKMKNPWGYHIILNPEIEEAYRALSNHPRCVVLNGFDIEPAEVIAASDLVISACFTSSTVEAWGADIPGVFYDATSLYRNYYYDCLPGFTLHGYLDLKRRVMHLLETKETPARLAARGEKERKACEKIDPFMDGKGITRFRNLLLEISRSR
ncbi:MAG: polysaccharide biosynthesis PFTS motif protein [Deltaproteobacteria bacterium]|nr:polysaccharide biosynthesis PFTS motif protein [Deltaproteobacteria bacterium]